MGLFGSGGAKLAPREPREPRRRRHDITTGTVRGGPRRGWIASRCSCGWWNDSATQREARSARAGHLATGR